jgi:hypothetical protein
LTLLRYHAVIGLGPKVGYRFRQSGVGRGDARRTECEDAMSDDPSLFVRAKDEIVERHAFFVRWFTDASAKLGEFRACERSFAAQFGMITPDGASHRRAEVLRRLRNAKASMPPLKFAIRIEGVTKLWASDDQVLVGYVEAQAIGRRRTRRRSTALFERRDQAPNGIVWRYLHESWIETTGVAGVSRQAKPGVSRQAKTGTSRQQRERHP